MRYTFRVVRPTTQLMQRRGETTPRPDLDPATRSWQVRKAPCIQEAFAFRARRACSASLNRMRFPPRPGFDVRFGARREALGDNPLPPMDPARHDRQQSRETWPPSTSCTRLIQASLEPQGHYGLTDAHGAPAHGGRLPTRFGALKDEVPVDAARPFDECRKDETNKPGGRGPQTAGTGTGKGWKTMEAGVGIEPAYTALQAVFILYCTKRCE